MKWGQKKSFTDAVVCAKCMIHTLFIYMWIVLTTIFFGIIAIVVSVFETSGNMSHKVARAWSISCLLVSLIKVRVDGLWNIKPDCSYIYMANHQSNYDIYVLLGYLPVQFRWLAKAMLFKIPIFGRAMRGAGYISIDRANRSLAIQSLKKAAETIRKGTSVVIFPEGTRSPDGRILPFKKGGFYLALDSGVPIVPVIIHGTRDIMAKNRLLIKPGNVLVEVMKPVKTSGYTLETRYELMNKIQNIMREAVEKKTE
jgi:1-acyl-sn-glycerol-3-phosphate acyltransferase